MHSITKTTFQVLRDRETDICYVTRAEDEETKNHKEVDKDINSGYMPERPGSKYCPVQSYLTYIYSLDRSVNDLWQRPRFDKFQEVGKGIWYGPTRV